MAERSVTYSFTGTSRVVGSGSGSSSSYIYNADAIKLTGVSKSGTAPSGATITGATLTFNTMKVFSTNSIYFSVRGGDDSTQLVTGNSDNARSYNSNTSSGTNVSPLTVSYYSSECKSAALTYSPSGTLYCHFNSGGGSSSKVFANNSTSGSLVINWYSSSGDDSGGGSGGSTKTKSYISSVTSSVNVGSSMAVTIAGGYVSSLTHKITYSFGSQSSTYTMSGTSHTFTVPASWGSVIPTADEGTATVTLTSYDGSTNLGQDSATFKVNVSGNPSVSIAISKRTQGNIDDYIQNLTTITVKATASPSIGASIKTYEFTCGSQKTTVTSDSASFVVPGGEGSSNGSFSLTVSCTVTDSRNRLGSTSTPVTAYNYSTPDVSNGKVLRCTANGTASDTGAYISISGTILKSVIGNRNTATLKVSYRNDNTSAWTTIETRNIAGNVSSQAYSKLYNASLDTSSSYSVQLLITDLANQTTEIIIPVTSSTYIMFFKSKGNGVGVGTNIATSETDIFKVEDSWSLKHGNNYIATMIVSSTQPSAREGVIWLKPV